ncbi:aspartate--ammonia ligase [Pseudofulvibacter geojedonensis]|uniref:Aspartate--ammonia ligase n=1 Tax=Pseudofulvibacter geojedonensis TaxID=1123758 RepID=A0ABW3HY09_9FLAO
MKTIKRSLASEQLITKSKEVFETQLKKRLNLTKVNAPLYVSENSGLNDNLNGVERPVSFKLGGVEHEIVHSLAKWKRWYLGELEAKKGEGIVTDMKAIRADEELSSIHSHLVDQWDWEKVIDKQERTIETLVAHGTAVFEALKETEKEMATKIGRVVSLPESLTVMHTEDLYEKYPALSSKEREHAITREFGAVLLIGIGDKLSNGVEHDLRAPDYDDWTTKDAQGRPGINADLLVWDSIREKSLEISSMGVRVDEKALEHQLKLTGQEKRKELPFHTALLAGKLPYTIGGGIGQSRVAMFVNKRADISTVQPIFTAY